MRPRYVTSLVNLLREEGIVQEIESYYNAKERKAKEYKFSGIEGTHFRLPPRK